ncbi:MAG: cytochrome c biogenesis protein ResB [Rickettsiales bacterium]|nr:cytochrome c biogenesis protein ResB [Rickettsiales bacterium]
MPNSASRILAFCTSPALIFWVMPWLMVLLVVGTISQRYIGLYEAERLFFSAWWVWAGPIPVPGVYTALGILTLGLVLKLALKTRWVRAQAGIILAHIGVLTLLIGGLVTAFTAQEGYLTLMQDEVGRVVSDYHQRELVLYEDDKVIQRIAFEALRVGEATSLNQGAFSLNLLDKCRNCKPMVDDNGRLSLASVELKKDDEANLSGITFEVSVIESVHILYEAIPRPIEFSDDGKNYKLLFTKANRLLPFAVKLNKFKKFSYPGSDTPSEYESQVTIIEESGLEWHQAIRMNEPLRTHGHTLYQSSFLEVNGQQASVLAVVKNTGFLFPYIASIIMALGLMLQVWIRSKKVLS